MIWAKLGSLMMFIAVALGAFGAHALRGKLGPHMMDIYKSAVLYHFVHGLGLFVVSWLSQNVTDPKVSWAGIFFLAGILLFSGSLYLLAITGNKSLGAITPLGGLAFLTGWAILFFSIKG